VLETVCESARLPLNVPQPAEEASDD
jgi:hypothetical protein